MAFILISVLPNGFVGKDDEIRKYTPTWWDIDNILLTVKQKMLVKFWVVDLYSSQLESIISEFSQLGGMARNVHCI